MIISGSLGTVQVTQELGLDWLTINYLEICSWVITPVILSDKAPNGYHTIKQRFWGSQELKETLTHLESITVCCTRDVA